MRSDLEILEQIDLYLGGKMSTADAAAFKAKIAANPELQSMVNSQELLIQTVNRQAMMAELNSIAAAAGAAGGAAGWGITQWMITAIIATATTVGGYFIYEHFNSNESTELVTDNEIESNEIIAENNVDTGDFISFELAEATDEYENEINAYTIFEDEDESNDLIERIVKVNFEKPIYNEGFLKSDNHKIQPDKSEKIATDKEQKSTNTIKSTTNRKAVYPGGLVKMKDFISKSLMYPRTPKDKGLQGTVKVYFLISAEGKISHVESDCFIMKDKAGKPLSSGKMIANVKSQKYFEKNAERLFRMSSPWEPATDSDGNPMVSGQTWYVNFDYNGQSSAYQLENEVAKNTSCAIHSESDWEKVDVQTMQVKSQSKKFKLIGEGTLQTTGEISDVEDLTSSQYKEICQTAAKHKACTIFIDVNNFWGAGDRVLYYYFGTFGD